MTDDFLDRAIDEIARDLTSAGPHAGFAGRVRERLETRRKWAPAVWQLAGAAAVILAVILVVARSPRDEISQPPVARNTGPAIHLPPLPGTVTPPPTLKAFEPPSRRRERTHRPAHAPERIPVPSEARQIPPLPEITELSVAVPEPEVLTLAALDVPELTVAPLTPEYKEPR